jgi:hypothetical protein
MIQIMVVWAKLTLAPQFQPYLERGDESGADQQDQPCQYMSADFKQLQIEWLDQ